MNYTVILTLLAFCISVYSISSDIQKRNFKYKFSKRDYFFLSFLLLILLVLLIIEDFLITSKGAENLRFYFSLSSFISLVIFIIYFSISFFRNKIVKHAAFLNSLNEQLIAEEYEIILKNLVVYIDFLVKEYLNQKQSTKNNNQESPIELLLEILFRDKKFISMVSINAPSFGVEIIKYFKCELAGLSAKFAFSYSFLKSLMENQGSIIYRQLEDNQNIHDSKYDIPQRNYLLYAIFENMNFAKDIRVYSPIGDAVLEYLHERKESKIDRDNKFPFDYEKEKWESLVFIGIRFFDIMILESIANNIDWHMWLYYFKSFTEKICENVRYDENAYLEDRNFINMYEYYLSEIFEAYISWVDSIYPSYRSSEDKKRYKISLSKIDSTNENNNIIKSALISMAQSLKVIAKSKNLRTRYKIALFDRFLNLYFKFIKVKVTADYGRVMYSLLETSKDKEFYMILKKTLDDFDRGSSVLDGAREEFGDLEKLAEKKLKT